MNAEYIQEPERTLPVRYADYDVIVAGGGIAGIFQRFRRGFVVGIEG